MIKAGVYLQLVRQREVCNKFLVPETLSSIGFPVMKGRLGTGSPLHASPLAFTALLPLTHHAVGVHDKTSADRMSTIVNMDMERVADLASRHPALKGAFVSIDGEWLDILLADGRSFRFRPNMLMADIADEAKPDVLVRLISIGIEHANPAPCEHDPALSSSTSPTTDAGSETPESWVQGIADPSTFDSTIIPPGLFDESDLDPNTPPYYPDMYEQLATTPLDIHDTESVLGHLMPIVKKADFFVVSHDHARDDSFIYVPLTDFVGAGIVIAEGPFSMTLRFTEADRLSLAPDIVSLFQKALTHLRTAKLTGGLPSVQVRPHPIAGAESYEFTGPEGYRGSWFMDVEMALSVADSVSKAHNDALPLFVPASENSFLMVLASDPKLPDFFASLSSLYDAESSLYPLPHVVSSEGWSEWIPLRDDPSYEILSKLRSRIRSEIYKNQVKAMNGWPGDFGTLVEHQVFMYQGHTATYARWTESSGYGSVPMTDYLVIERRPSPRRWDRLRTNTVIIRTEVAKDVWPRGITDMHNVWPPRLAITGFPSDRDFEELTKAASRDF